MSTRAFVRRTLTNSYYSLCPFLSSGAMKWFISRSSGQAARFWAEEGDLGNPFMNKGLVPKGHTSPSPMSFPQLQMMHSFTHSCIPLTNIFWGLELSQAYGIWWWAKEVRSLPSWSHRPGGRQTQNKLLIGALNWAGDIIKVRGRGLNWPRRKRRSLEEVILELWPEGRTGVNSTKMEGKAFQVEDRTQAKALRSERAWC